MKKNTRLLLGITAITAVAVAGIIMYRKRKNYRYDDDNMLSQVAEEGYETAHDVLFPNKSKKGRGRNKDLRYGPVLPR
jgi:hypothetical protein